MASMRRVTKKPPKMLTPAKNTEIPANIITRLLVEPICSAAPRMMIEEMAFVTAINGVCNEWHLHSRSPENQQKLTIQRQ